MKDLPKMKDLPDTLKMVYTGQTFDSDNVLRDRFKDALAIEDNEAIPFFGEVFQFKAAKRRLPVVIGGIYEVRHENRVSFNLSSLDRVGYVEDQSMIKLWSTEDRAAQMCRATFNKRKALKKENEEAWKECMAPILKCYKRSTRTERNAIRLMMLDMLGEVNNA